MTDASAAEHEPPTTMSAARPTPKPTRTPPARARTVRLTLSYDGTDFHGWQVQPALRTVQGTLDAALSTLLREPIRSTGAGRTDAGVHALGQVASFDTNGKVPAARFPRALGPLLPQDLVVIEGREAPLGWSARHAARGKHYRYRLVESTRPLPLEARYAHRVPGALDVAAMRAAARALVGTHDFKSLALASDPRPTVRTLFAIDVTREGRGVTIDVRGDGFLHKMVRTLAGTLVDVGLGRRSAADVEAGLRVLDRGAFGPTLPPNGLFMVSVVY